MSGNKVNSILLLYGNAFVFESRSLEVEVSGWRNELRLRLFDGRRHRLPHIEVFQPPDEDNRRRRRLADDHWHTVSIRLSSTISDAGSHGFYVRVYIDCLAVAGRRVEDFGLPWTETKDFDGLSYLWIGQRTTSESLLKASRSLTYSLTPRDVAST